MRTSPACGRQAARRGQGGALLIEVLVSIVVCAFGLLGFVAVQARAVASEFESHQRTQALTLVDDMVSRINANRADAGAYVVEGLVGEGAIQDCTGLAGAALDLCQWGNLIRGSREERDGVKVGAMLSARGCITRPATSSDRYVVAVVWQGLVATGAPPNPCGLADAAFASEPLRRTVSYTVCIGLLRDPAVAPALARC
jgi:type IV pilus assembly protein PilV